GRLDEVAAFIDDGDVHAGRQFVADLRQARLDAVTDDAGVFAHEHHHRAKHDLLAVHGGCAAAEAGTPGDLGDVRHLERFDRSAELHRQLGNLVDRADSADAAHGELLALAADDTTAGVFDVAADDVGEFANRHVGRLELVEHRLDRDLALVPA